MVLKVKMVLRRGRIRTQKGSEKNIMIDQPNGEAHCGRMRKRNRRTKGDSRQSFFLCVFLVSETDRSVKPAHLTEYMHIAPKVGNYD